MNNTGANNGDDIFETTFEEFGLMVDHLSKPAQRAKVRRGALAVSYFPGAIIANDTKCTTLSQLVAVTRALKVPAACRLPRAARS
jgi:hypothetical protein